MNNLKTVGLLAFMAALLGLIAISLGQSIWVGLGIAAVFNLGAYFFSDKLALASSRAKPVEEHELPQVYSIVRALATQTNMPMPRIYVIDSPQPNAFATGRSPNHAAVAVTSGILQIMTYEELQGVLAHELAHVRNRDILISSIAAMIGSAIAILARSALWFGGGRDRENPLGAVGALIALIVGPMAAVVIRMGISRAREYQADRTGAEITGQPMQLASALAKIGQATAQIPMNVDPAFSQLYIDNPLKALRGGSLLRMLSTHPPVEERIERLREMAYGPR
ncbi:MAG: zinc metalloprotease HtpX [Acidimicrobiia bacterium]|nr:zinc metalloprotease HtpX [Acidimicrobiia bacterium]MDH4305872.1 zinc metalloprotease HtpX [Acidimicrobiia bacterium]MDH5294516.1 zinc metalloprotease HtpX [Acidimicrobiia bacterium]